METAEALMGMLFNAALVIMIVATMFSAGLSTTLSALGGVFKNVWLVVLVLIAAFLIRPLVGWGTAALLALATPAFIAMLLLAACPGAPFGAKLVMTARGDLITGATLQVLMAAIGSITFPITANWLISAAGLGGDFSLPVWDLVKTVAVLQLIPFVVGIGVRHWSPETAAKWNPPVTQTSTYAFVIVLALALLGSWQTLVALIGSRTILAGIIFAVLMIVLGYFVAVGGKKTRSSVALLEPISNAGPVFAAVAIAFNNDPEILGAATGIILVQIIVGIIVASYFAKGQPEPEDTLANDQTSEAQPA
jgi:BASS family bile acid:Na+ symporter